jgi:hypothetical protein
MCIIQWINIVRIIEYHFVSLHELSECAIGNNVKVWTTNKGTQTFWNFLFIVFSNPNKKNYIVIDAKCLVFLWFSQETLVSISRVLETQYQFIGKPCYRKTPFQALISSSCAHHLLLGFWQLMSGYVTPFDWYPNFLRVKIYLKCLFVSTPHYLYRDLDVETLVGKCVKRWDTLYHKKTLIKSY